MSIRTDQRGYTLIELIVATVITSILVIGVMTFLVTSLTNNSIRQARADLLREAQLSLDVITKDARLSANVDENNRIEDVNSPNASTTNGLGWVSDGNTLILATAVEDTSKNIVFQDTTHYISEKNNIIYYVQDNTLYKRTLAADLPNNSSRTTCPPSLATASCPADRLSVENVSALNFRYYNSLDQEVSPPEARSVEVTLSLRKRKYNRDIDVTYSTRMVFRNE